MQAPSTNHQVYGRKKAAHVLVTVDGRVEVDGERRDKPAKTRVRSKEGRHKRKSQ